MYCVPSCEEQELLISTTGNMPPGQNPVGWANIPKMKVTVLHLTLELDTSDFGCIWLPISASIYQHKTPSKCSVLLQHFLREVMRVVGQDGQDVQNLREFQPTANAASLKK